MGVTASLTRYPAEVFAEVKAKRSFYPPNGSGIEHCYLDRSWDELRPALNSFGYPLTLALSGDYGYAGGLDTFGWGDSTNEDHYLGIVSPPVVQEIATALRDLRFEQVVMRLSKPSRGTDYLHDFYHALLQFYSMAATEGNCVFICVA